VDIPPELIEAKSAAELDLLALAGVVGVGLGMREEDGELFDELAVRILVEDASALPDGLPDEVGGVAVCIVERQVEPCAFPDTTRYPELAGGVMVTNPTLGSGTLGAIVEDTSTGELLGLSCFHVVGDTTATFPDTVWQPTNPPLIAGGTIPADDNIGNVVRVDFPQTPPLPGSPIRVAMTDSAVVALDAARSAGRTLSRAILDQGLGLPNLVDAVTATAEPSPGIGRVRKRGCMTGVKAGVVVARWLTVQWKPGGPNAFLMGQVEVSGDDPVFCQPGDSGSLVLDETTPTAIGLLWGQNVAGFVPAGKIGYFSEIGNVESHLGVSTVWA
jgi:hypothetical protein